MALWRITVNSSVYLSGVQLEPGMSVQISSRVYNEHNPLFVTNNKEVNDAFQRIYGFDLQKAGLLHPMYLDVELISNNHGHDSYGRTSEHDGCLTSIFKFFLRV